MSAARAIAFACGALLAALPAPAQFVRAVWLDAEQGRQADLLQSLRARGYTTVNLPRGQDPAAAIGAGLQIYLDQPAGKLLEMDAATWNGLHGAFDRTRDNSALRRPLCPATAPWLDTARERLDRSREPAATATAAFVLVADEASATQHCNPLDLCQCEDCLQQFRRFLQQRHGDLAGLNQAWGSEHRSFDEVVPMHVDALRRRELYGAELPRTLRPWHDHRDFVDQQFAAAVQSLLSECQARWPNVPVGLFGMQPPSAYGGHDYLRLMPMQQAYEAYDVGGARELALALAPQARSFRTLTAPPEGAPPQWLQAQLCDAAAHGESGAIVWNATELQSRPAYAEALDKAFARLGPALDACAGATVVRDPVWLVESPRSVRVWWMLDSAADDRTWVRRLSSYEAEHSTSLAARKSWFCLLADLGLQPQVVGEDELAEKLLQQRPRCLVLPATIALSSRACQAIEVYVQNGGHLVADHSTALYDEHLVRRERGGLDALFGIAARDLRRDAQVEQGRCGDDASRLVPAERGLQHAREQALCQRSPLGDLNLERTHDRGRTTYLNLPVCEYAGLRLDPARVQRAQDQRARVRQALRHAGVAPAVEVHGKELPTCLERTLLTARDGRTILAVRVHALGAVAVLNDLGRRRLLPVTLRLAPERRLSLLDGSDLGTAREFELSLDPFAGLFVVVGPP